MKVFFVMQRTKDSALSHERIIQTIPSKTKEDALKEFLNDNPAYKGKDVFCKSSEDFLVRYSYDTRF